MPYFKEYIPNIKSIIKTNLNFIIYLEKNKYLYYE